MGSTRQVRATQTESERDTIPTQTRESAYHSSCVHTDLVNMCVSTIINYLTNSKMVSVMFLKGITKCKVQNKDYSVLSKIFFKEKNNITRAEMIMSRDFLFLVRLLVYEQVFLIIANTISVSYFIGIFFHPTSDFICFS